MSGLTGDERQRLRVEVDRARRHELNTTTCLACGTTLTRTARGRRYCNQRCSSLHYHRRVAQTRRETEAA